MANYSWKLVGNPGCELVAN